MSAIIMGQISGIRDAFNIVVESKDQEINQFKSKLKVSEI